MRHDIPEEQASKDRTRVPLFCLDGHTECMDASSSAREAHAREMHEKAGSISKTWELPWPVRGDMKKRLSTKPVWANRPRV
jgi:hypothetical protein